MICISFNNNRNKVNDHSYPNLFSALGKPTHLSYFLRYLKKNQSNISPIILFLFDNDPFAFLSSYEMTILKCNVRVMTPGIFLSIIISTLLF